MKKFTLYIGLNDRITKVQEISTPRAKDMVYDELFSYGIRGFNFRTARGVWQYEDLSVSEENTFIIEIMTDETSLPVGLIRALKEVLNQESIGVTTETVDCQFL